MNLFGVAELIVVYSMSATITIIISWMNRDVPFDDLLGHCSCCDCATVLALADRPISSRGRRVL